MPLISVDSVTKDYGHGRGNFDVKLDVDEGEVFGFVGVNGAGKTTLIRQMMGFLKSDSGSITIEGRDAWGESSVIKRHVGYVPGEIAFPDSPTGTAFLKKQADLLNLKDMSRADEITKLLQLDPTANLKRMSKGMKQKTAIVAAFMASPSILLLDEPTTGLDPLMRRDFIDLIAEEKAKGTTVFMSSHMFEEVEECCDRVAFIRDGSIMDIKRTVEIAHNTNKLYKAEFSTASDYERFTSQVPASRDAEGTQQTQSGDQPGTKARQLQAQQGALYIEQLRPDQNQAFIRVHDNAINRFMAALGTVNVKFITEVKYSLEQYFKDLNTEENNVQ
ncbi:ABC transporter ATP-binding protein [Ancrocorticia populi]|uniref:ABC transporter ATP-binding protein n=1 Tax=Ancrocorticia populi TaxID=2175228 RepID=UPI003F99C679